MEKIADIFRRPIKVSPEMLGAALFELTGEQLQTLVARAAKNPAVLGGVETDVFFAETVALLMFAVQHAVGRKIPEPGARERTLAAFRERYAEYRAAFHGRTLSPAEVAERAAAYDELAGGSGQLAPPGPRFVRYCGQRSPMAATSASALFQEHTQAALGILDKAIIEG